MLKGSWKERNLDYIVFKYGDKLSEYMDYQDDDRALYLEIYASLLDNPCIR